MQHSINQCEPIEMSISKAPCNVPEWGMILVIAADPFNRRAARLSLATEGFDVGEADSLEKASLRLKMVDFNIVLIDGDDFGSPVIDLIRRLREAYPALPIFMQSSSIDDEKEIHALDAGANALLSKPVNARLLAAKATSAMRFQQSRRHLTTGLLAIGDLVVDPVRHEVRKSGVSVHLSIQEFKALHFLMEKPGELLSYETFTDFLWGNRSADLRTRLRVLINNLRRKLETDPTHPKYILNEMHLGYRFRAEHPESVS